MKDKPYCFLCNKRTIPGWSKDGLKYILENQKLCLDCKKIVKQKCQIPDAPDATEKPVFVSEEKMMQEQLPTERPRHAD